MLHILEISVVCRHCSGKDVCKNGKHPSGTQRWLCNSCKKSFQTDYKYNACKAGVKDAIVEQTLNSSGVRDISRNLKIDRNTVMSVLRKKKAQK